MEEFKYGDKVTHHLHGTGRVANSYPEAKLVQVIFEASPEDRDSKRFGTLVHPTSLKLVADPWRPVSIKWTNGENTSTRVRESELIEYLKNLPMDRIAGLDVGWPE